MLCHFYSRTEVEIWDLPMRLIDEDIKDMIEIHGLFNGVEPETTTEDVVAEAEKFHLKPPINKGQ